MNQPLIFKSPDLQIFKSKDMSKTVDFKKSIQGLSEQDLQARILEDDMRLKKLDESSVGKNFERAQILYSTSSR